MTLAVAATVACKKETTPKTEGPQAQKVNLTVRIEDPMATKATGIKGDATDEEKVNTLQVFVFNGETIDGYGTTENATSLNIGCTVGSREIYALANTPDLRSVTSKTELLGMISRLGNDVTNFEMIGIKSEDISAGTETVTISVDRLASRVVVKKVTNALTSPALKEQDFVLKSMFLTNVATDVDYGLSGNHVVENWYNKMAYSSADNSLGNMIYDEIEEALEDGHSHDTEHCFYAYPNSSAHSTSLTWSPRSTMLVLKIMIGETLYDYPILLPALENNRSYEIDEIKITRPGNKDDGLEGGTDEQEPVEGKDCSFTIIVNPWTTTAITEGTTI